MSDRGLPIARTVPEALAILRQSSNEAEAPVPSRATSTPLLFVFDIIQFSALPSDELKTSSMPILRAKSSFSLLRPIRKTWPAPAIFANWQRMMPIVPGPTMAILSPIFIFERLRACMATEEGSNMAADSNDILSGRKHRFHLGTATYSANPPSHREPR